MTRRRLAILFSCLVCLALARAALAQPRLDLSQVQVGLAQQHKLGRWTPVRLSLASDGQSWQGKLRIGARDGDDIWATDTGGPLAEVKIGPRDATDITAYVRIGRQQSTLRIEAMANESSGAAATWHVPLAPALLATQQRVLVVGGDIGLREATRLIPRDAGEELIGSRIEEIQNLPENWIGYDGIDALVLTGGDPKIYSALTSAQSDAIDMWVSQGGRLVVTVGARGEVAFAAGELLRRFAPGDYQRTVPLRETTSVESFAEATQRLDETSEGLRRQPPLYTQLANVRGEVLLSAQRDQPIIVRAAHGFGQVIFVGLDLESEPLADWEDRPRLVARLLETTFDEQMPGDAQAPGGEAAHLGFDDLSGQLRAALDVFDGASLVNFSTVAALIVLYVLLIGPADYLLVTRVLRRRELTWMTSGAIIIAFCALAWWIAGRSRGEAMRVNQVDIVDIDAGASRVRGTSFLHVYSPNNRSYDLALAPTVDIADNGDPPGVLLSWQGLPGEALGGMNRNSGVGGGTGEYLLVDHSANAQPANISIQGLPIAAGGSKALSARWWSKTRPLTEYNLQYDDDQLLSGHFDNPLPVRLTNCLLFHDRWVYRLGNLEPGQRVAIADVVGGPLDSQWLLTERKIVDVRDETRPWDPAMRDDVPKIVRMMMFHELARGRSHTKLLHRQERHVDMTQLLSSERAVLLGRSEAPATTLSDGEGALGSDGDQRWTFCRIVFPTQPDEK